MQPIYKVFSYLRPPSESELNELGKLGFELVSLVYFPDHNQSAQGLWVGCFRNTHLATLYKEQRAISLIPCEQCQDARHYLGEDRYAIGLSEYLLDDATREVTLDLLRKTQTDEAKKALRYWEKYQVVLQRQEEINPYEYVITRAFSQKELLFTFDVFPDFIDFGSVNREKISLDIQKARLLFEILRSIMGGLMEKLPEAGVQNTSHLKYSIEGFSIKFNIGNERENQVVDLNELEIDFLLEHLLEAIKLSEDFANMKAINSQGTFDDLPEEDRRQFYD